MIANLCCEVNTTAILQQKIAYHTSNRVCKNSPSRTCKREMIETCWFALRYIKARHSKGIYVLVGPYKDASSGKMIATLGKTLSGSGWGFWHLFFEALVCCDSKPNGICFILTNINYRQHSEGMGKVILITSVCLFTFVGGGVPSSFLTGGYLILPDGRGVHTPIPGQNEGYPHLADLGGEVPHLADRGYPHHPGLDGIPPVKRQSSIASTCYAAGGVPLAFTQDDLLVNQPVSDYISSLNHF